jgi:hypothetical protein
LTPKRFEQYLGLAVWLGARFDLDPVTVDFERNAFAPDGFD